MNGQAASLGPVERPVSDAARDDAVLSYACIFGGSGKTVKLSLSRDETRASRAHPGEGTSNRPVGGEIVEVVDVAARGEQRDDLRRRLPGGLFV